MIVRELIELLLQSDLSDEVTVTGEETIGHPEGAHATSTILSVSRGDGTTVGISLPQEWGYYKRGGGSRKANAIPTLA